VPNDFFFLFGGSPSRFFLFRQIFGFEPPDPGKGTQLFASFVLPGPSFFRDPPAVRCPTCAVFRRESLAEVAGTVFRPPLPSAFPLFFFLPVFSSFFVLKTFTPPLPLALSRQHFFFFFSFYSLGYLSGCCPQSVCRCGLRSISPVFCGPLSGRRGFPALRPLCSHLRSGRINVTGEKKPLFSAFSSFLTGCFFPPPSLTRTHPPCR